jgi:hypothetical protein
MDFTENKSNPCVMSKLIDDNVVMIGVYIDDCLVVGKEELI